MPWLLFFVARSDELKLIDVDFWKNRLIHLKDTSLAAEPQANTCYVSDHECDSDFLAFIDSLIHSAQIQLLSRTLIHLILVYLHANSLTYD